MAFRSQDDAAEHVALLIGAPNGQPPLIRLHSECLTGDVFGSLKCDCGPQLRAALRLITGKWKGEIMWSLKDGKRRFGELMRGIPGITQHMLTAQLRDMERHGLIARTVYAEVPPRVEYELTPVAIGLKPVFEELNRWAEEHAATLRLGEVDEQEEVSEGGPKR